MKKVKIYTTPTCVYCKKAKAYFEKNNIDFEEVNIAADESAQQAMIAKTGQLTVPVIEVGEKFLLGWNQREFDATYTNNNGEKR